jgi:hypothetical protein
LATKTTGPATVTPSCIASANLTPVWYPATSYGYPIYRLVGALYTDNSSPTPHVVPFQQDGDSFYLATSVTDIPAGTICSGTIGTTAVSCPLSVPCGRTASATACPSPGLAVQAFGRIVGGSNGSGTSRLLLSSLDQSDQAPAAFPTSPGNTNSGGMGLSTTPPVFPFHLSTDGSGNVRARASLANTAADEITDGWVWHRQR